MSFLRTKNSKPKKSNCVICKREFEKTSMRHKACGFECALELVARERKKEERKSVLIRREELKTRSDWLREAQAEFNAFIRERDIAEPCISCGRFHSGSYDAGHYRSVGSMPSLRFNEDNVHKQCVPCNQYKGGNIVEYRIRLLTKIGPERLAFLEGPHEPIKLTIDDAKAIKKTYKLKRRELRDERADREAA